MPTAPESASTQSTTPAGRPTAREQARLRKQRQRQRSRERARLAAAALAAERERTDELLAPAVLRRPILDPAGGMIRGAKIAVVNGHPVRALPLPDPIGNLGRSPLFGPARIAAARQFQHDAALIGEGVNATPSNPLGTGGGGGHGDGTGAHHCIIAQLAAQDRLRGALGAMGWLAPVVVKLTIDCLPAVEIARQSGVPSAEVPRETAEVLQQVAAGLERLARFYWPPNPNPGRAPRSAAFVARSIASASNEVQASV